MLLRSIGRKVNQMPLPYRTKHGAGGSGVTRAAGTLDWDDDTADDTPDFTYTTADMTAGDTARLEWYSDVGLTSLVGYSENIVSAGEEGAQALTFVVGQLNDGVYYFRAKHSAPGGDGTWSNTETVTIATLAAMPRRSNIIQLRRPSLWKPRRFNIIGQRAGLLLDTGAFSPSSLSPALWVEARNGVFQSNAGTTAATANSDPVGYITDLSGNGYHLNSVADDTTRPLLQGVGANPYLDFDGSNDLLKNGTSLGLYAGGAFSVFVAMKGNPATDAVFVGEGASGGTNPMTRIIHAQNTTATTLAEHFRDDAGSTISINQVGGTNAFDNTDRVIGMTDDGAGVLVGYVNSNAFNSVVDYTRGTITLNRFGLGAGYRSVTGNYFLGRMYGMVCTHSVLSAGERANLLTYLGNLAGLSL